MRHTQSVMLLFAVVHAWPGALTGQARVPGARIRVTAPDIRLYQRSGELLSLDANLLVLRMSTGQSDARRVIPRDLLQQLEVSAGIHRRTGKGLVLGAAIGLGMGLLVTGFGDNARCEGSGDGYGEQCAALVGATQAFTCCAWRRGTTERPQTAA